jgi:hypothetical protein
MNSMSTRSVVGAVGGCVAGLILIATVFSSAAERADIASFSPPPAGGPSASATPDLVPPQPPVTFTTPSPVPSSPPAPAHKPPVIHHPVVPPKPPVTVVPRPKKPTAAPTCPIAP